jgi:hypothetical protein
MVASNGFGDQLVGAGLISKDQLTEATRVADSSGKKIHEEVISLGYAPAGEVTGTYVRQLQRADHFAGPR